MDRFFSGMRYRFLRRLSRPGMLVVGGFCLATLVGLDVQHTIAYQAFALLFVLLVVSVILTIGFRGRFSVHRELPRFGTAGVPMEYTVTVRNEGRRAQSDLTFLENLSDPRPRFPEWRDFVLNQEKMSDLLRLRRRRHRNPFPRARVREAPIDSLLPQGEARVSVQLMPLRRGVLRLTGATVARADPLGLFRAFRRVRAPESTLILPKRYLVPHIALPGRMQYQEGGVALASNVGRSEEFVSLRDYRRGDPLRLIHWRSWAKAGRPIVKECEDEFFVRHALILDTFADRPHSEVFEEAVSVAASFACTLVTQESLLDLLFVSAEVYCFTAGRGVGHADQMLELLASVPVCRDKPFTTLETAVLNHAGIVSGCICVFLEWDEARRELVRKLRMLDLPLTVFVIVAAGENTALEPGPMDDCPAQFHVLESGRIEEGLSILS
jgi:uncharacterized protein (DUF58 family)